MKNLVLKHGLIAGILVSVFLVIGTNLAGNGNMDMDLGQILGYAGMLLAFSTIFMAITKKRKEEGYITFKQAVIIGVNITIIASLLYTITWMIISSGPGAQEMMDGYFEEVIAKVKESGASEEEVNKKMDQMNKMKENYNNPFFKFFVTFLEIFPVGVIVSIISGLILRRKP